ncbi:unnamed protein product [Echinostoma caproni]|uniref:IF rod domain-containing protein n=1 Tax=Echinostoma caproni TaxID=27848 RepID=A0A183B1K0_9TREM|nr:unnamed protein product [Echinostoma caproni]
MSIAASRVKELEEMLDEERAVRIRTERELGELNAEFDVLTANYHEANEQISLHVSML